MQKPTGRLKFAYDTISRMESKIKELDKYHTNKHSRDVELTDLLTHLAERYGDLMTPQDRERIEELTKPL